MQTLEPYQLFPRCRNGSISYIHHAGSAQIIPDQRRPWNSISCSHAAEIARFHIFTMQVQHRYGQISADLGTLSVVSTLQKLHDFIYPPCRISPDQPTSAQIKPDHPKSTQIMPDQPRSAQISPEHSRSPQITSDQPRSAQISPD